MKPAIGILLRALDLGGAEKQSLLLAHLLESEYDIYFFVQKKIPCLQQHLNYIKENKINYIQLKGGMLLRSLQLRRYLKKYGIKIVFAYLTTDNVLAGISSIFCKTKFIGGLRSSCLPSFKLHITRIVHNFFLNSTIINNHYGVAYFIKNGFRENKLKVIHNCLETINKPIVKKTGDTIRILSVGRFTKAKDYKTALLAIHYLHNNYKIDLKVKYTIIGDGELEAQIKNWIDELQISDIEIIKLPENINDFYYNSDIYFLTSVFEGLPNTIMEAINYSLPVVATDVGDVKYLVENGKNGYIVEIGDYKKMAYYLYELIRNPSLRAAFGRYGIETILNQFSIDEFKSKYIEFIKRIIS